MGGFDLYGNYYNRIQDARSAELAQMNEIDNQNNRRRLEEQEQEIRALKQKLKQKGGAG